MSGGWKPAKADLSPGTVYEGSPNRTWSVSSSTVAVHHLHSPLPLQLETFAGSESSSSLKPSVSAPVHPAVVSPQVRVVSPQAAVATSPTKLKNPSQKEQVRYKSQIYSTVPRNRKYEFASPVDARTVRYRKMGISPPSVQQKEEKAVVIPSTERATVGGSSRGRSRGGTLGFRRRGYDQPKGPPYSPSPIAWLTDHEYPWEVSPSSTTRTERTNCDTHACTSSLVVRRATRGIDLDALRVCDRDPVSANVMTPRGGTLPAVWPLRQLLEVAKMTDPRQSRWLVCRPSGAQVTQFIMRPPQRLQQPPTLCKRQQTCFRVRVVRP